MHSLLLFGVNEQEITVGLIVSDFANTDELLAAMLQGRKDAEDEALNDTNQNWPFGDPPSTAVFTDVRFLNGDDWIQFTHDADDGAWQFHGSQGMATMQSAAVVALKQVVAIDKTIEELADLPPGWQA